MRRPQMVQVSDRISFTHTVSEHRSSTRFSAPLPVLAVHSRVCCVAKHSSDIMFKIADHTTILCLITDGDETAYTDEVRALWSKDSKLCLNISKTKEKFADYVRTQEDGRAPLYISGVGVSSSSECTSLTT